MPIRQERPQTTDEITVSQAEQIDAKVRPMLTYLTLLQKRMEKNEFDQTDKFYQLVEDAREAIFNLSVKTHYMTCKTGVHMGERK